MPFVSQKPQLFLTEDERSLLDHILESSEASVKFRDRARLLLMYANGETISSIARSLATNRPKVERTVNKALQFGIHTALEDLPRTGKPVSITHEAREWIRELAQTPPQSIGIDREKWTFDSLSRYIRNHCDRYGHSCLHSISNGTVSKILSGYRKRQLLNNTILPSPKSHKDKRVTSLYLTARQLMRNNTQSPSTLLMSYPVIRINPSEHSSSLNSKKSTEIAGNDTEYGIPGETPQELNLFFAVDLKQNNILLKTENHFTGQSVVHFFDFLNRSFSNYFRIQVYPDFNYIRIFRELKDYLKRHPNRFELMLKVEQRFFFDTINYFIDKLISLFIQSNDATDLSSLEERLSDFISLSDTSLPIYQSGPGPG